MTFLSPNGTRCSTEQGYLTDEVLSRPNLAVLSGAHVTRILFEDTESQQKKAVGIEFSSGKRKTYRVRAAREIIITCGTVHTPQILMLR